MARRRNDSDDDVSLFPFLSIIACVIGVLTLMISTLALAQLDTTSVVQAEELEKAQKDVEKAKQEMADLEKKLEAEKKESESMANELQQETIALKRSLEQLSAELEEKQTEYAEQLQIKIVIPTVAESQRETVDDMKAQLVDLREKIAQLEKQIADRKLPPDEAEVSILPAGSGLDQKPYFVECAADSMVIHGGAKPIRLRAAEMAASKDFIKVLEQVASNKKAILLFLVRSDGLNTYRQAKKLADANEVTNGKLPVVGNGRIDLEYFKGAK